MNNGANAETTNGRHHHVCVLCTTDAPLKSMNKDFIPLASLLINFDIPIRKEEYLKRIGSVLGGRSRGQRIAVSFVKAGRIADLRNLESFAEKEIQEMPVHVVDIFAQP